MLSNANYYIRKGPGKLYLLPYCLSLFIFLLPLFPLTLDSAFAQFFPAAGWHRGDVSAAQENSKKALLKALRSGCPNFEVDIIDFMDEKKGRVGLLVHDYEMDRIAGLAGNFLDYKTTVDLPRNSANPDLTPEPYMTIIELFDLIKETKEKGTTPVVSLDMKEEGDKGEEFGRWVGQLIKNYGFKDHVFASSFFRSNIAGVKATCPECMVGGLVFIDHWALKGLDWHYTSVDLTGISKLTFFLGFLGKEEYPLDFVLIQDDVFFENPALADYWKNKRQVKFIGVFTYKKENASYTEDQWKKLQTVDWLELDPPQMKQHLEIRKCK